MNKKEKQFWFTLLNKIADVNYSGEKFSIGCIDVQTTIEMWRMNVIINNYSKDKPKLEFSFLWDSRRELVFQDNSFSEEMICEMINVLEDIYQSTHIKITLPSNYIHTNFECIIWDGEFNHFNFNLLNLMLNEGFLQDTELFYSLQEESSLKELKIGETMNFHLRDNENCKGIIARVK